MEMMWTFENYKMIYKILKSFLEEHENYVEVDLTLLQYREVDYDWDYHETIFEACDEYGETYQCACTISLNESSETPVTINLAGLQKRPDRAMEIPVWDTTLRIKNEFLEVEWWSNKASRWARLTIKDKQLLKVE